MNEEDNFMEDDADRNKSAMNNINKVLAILFVAGIYFVIFLKILFIN